MAAIPLSELVTFHATPLQNVIVYEHDNLFYITRFDPVLGGTGYFENGNLFDFRSLPQLAVFLKSHTLVQRFLN